jgi:hypothetical protein
MAEVSSVLRTPWDIFQAVTQIFPQAKATTNVNSTTGRITLITTISGKTVVVFRHAADTIRLSATLRDLFQKIILGRQPSMIAEHRYRRAEPLTDWQTFRRIMYERSGSLCSSTILQYVKDPSDTNCSVLSFLGFSPQQVDDDEQVSGDDLAYFRTVFEQIHAADLNRDTRKQLCDSMRRLFPSIYMTLFREIFVRWATNVFSPSAPGDADDVHDGFGPDTFDDLGLPDTFWNHDALEP